MAVIIIITQLGPQMKGAIEVGSRYMYSTMNTLIKLKLNFDQCDKFDSWK